MPLPTDPKALALSRNLLQAFDKVDGGYIRVSGPLTPRGHVGREPSRPFPDAASLTRAPHAKGETPVTVRFSDFAGVPNVADNDPQYASPRGCAIRFQLGEHVHTTSSPTLMMAFLPVPPRNF